MQTYIEIYLRLKKQFHNLIRTMSSEDRIVFPSDDKNIKAFGIGGWSGKSEFSSKGKDLNYFMLLKKGHSSLRFFINKRKLK
ncbi:MAG: hypothetical protein Ct9H300mP3_00480 [Gammaproteobacteria bacterium]|nr:MAG: hypothetical protein Ct9H300mP3_00480 [Gammaproteobacteria bacterium]